MLKILSAQQTRELDQYTIQNEPITPIDLMERASRAFMLEFCGIFSLKNTKVVVLCGVGNNGGDGFAVARMLQAWQYEVHVIHALVSEKLSVDCQINKDRLPKEIEIIELRKGDDFPQIEKGEILIDAFFGSGLNRPIEGFWGALIQHLNAQKNTRVAIDISSGLFADRASEGNIIKADYTITFQFPKLAFFFAENDKYVGAWRVVDIELSKKGIEKTRVSHFQIDNDSIAKLIKRRGKHDHKGTFGHALLIAGSYGKIGAAVLSAKAILRTGAGLASVYVPKCGYQILQISLPEAMVLTDRNEYLVSKIPDLTAYRAIGVGPGIGTDPLTVQALEELLKSATIPLVLDADALNIISKNPDFFQLIPPNSILTPHPKEFERLFGKTNNAFERLNLQVQKSKALQIFIILKGGYTSISTPDGQVYFSSAGNPGMGTGGSGDVLTGMLTGLLAQQYSPLESCLIGVHLHGVAGDLAAKELGQESLMAGDLVEFIGKVYLELSFNR
ncbi:MAG: NAD(P)H-hydrate dehydratase [Bacteroidota bacterium]